MTLSRRSLLTGFILACCAPAAVAAPLPVGASVEIAHENPLIETVRRRRRRRRPRRRRHGRRGWRRPTMNDGWY
ncbi:MAG TPA: hypothetical protein VE686_07180 [Beijerinckiaceae bacterium]|jgi:hypothetical protein|nr:hypothetical protein [Beijerinckiaceae bacterium]